MIPFGDFFRNRRVLITGHTGFKGAWLAFWLKNLGAEVHGFALRPNTTPSIFNILELEHEIDHSIIDIRYAAIVEDAIRKIKPEIIFHLAAQSLVRVSYKIPIETLETNVMGTANLLEAVRKADYSGDKPCCIVIVTSDKCYENQENLHAYCETDPMGGHDIYSMSKGAAELLISAWRKSFFPTDKISHHGISLASARAGNIIGGGDWNDFRIITDCMRALIQDKAIEVRNPASIRPWQHVLEPLSGYLHLCREMVKAHGQSQGLLSAWNFGPGEGSEHSVRELVDKVIECWGEGSCIHKKDPNDACEAKFLKLSINKSEKQLGWKPVWNFDTSVMKTVLWHKRAHLSHYNNEILRKLTKEQIDSYVEDAASKSLAWV